MFKNFWSCIKVRLVKKLYFIIDNAFRNFCRHLQRRHVVVHRDYLREKEKPSSSVAQSSISDYVPSKL